MDKRDKPSLDRRFNWSYQEGAASLQSFGHFKPRLPTQLDFQRKWIRKQHSLRLDEKQQCILWYVATAGANITHHRHEAEGNSGKQTKAA